MWQPGDTMLWRGIFRNQIWHAMSMIVVKDTPQELVNFLFPGAECMAEEHYARRVKDSKRRWDFKDREWQLEKCSWHTNRVVMITEPGKYYSTLLFWEHASNAFLGYYINFQLPYDKSHCGIDSLDLDLDIDVEPDLSFNWKDEDDYRTAVEQGVIAPEWVKGIDDAKPEILKRIEQRQYPFDGSWLDWKPDPAWMPPKLPANWDKI